MNSCEQILFLTYSELLSGDVKSVNRLATSGLDVYAHNMETVARLQRHVRDRCVKLSSSFCFG